MILTKLLKSKYGSSLRSLKVDEYTLDQLKKVKVGDVLSVVMLDADQKAKFTRTSKNGNLIEPEAWLTIEEKRESQQGVNHGE